MCWFSIGCSVRWKAGRAGMLKSCQTSPACGVCLVDTGRPGWQGPYDLGAMVSGYGAGQTAGVPILRGLDASVSPFLPRNDLGRRSDDRLFFYPRKVSATMVVDR